MSTAAVSTHPFQPGLAVLTAEQRENYKTLTARRKEWLTELAPDFDKRTRADARGLAFSILLSGEGDPKQAMMLAVEQISARQALQDQLGRNLFLSSEADPPVDPPVIQQVQAQPHIQPSQFVAPHPPQLATIQESNPQLGPLQESNIIPPAQVLEQPKDKDKAKRVDSDSDDAKPKKMKAKRNKKRAPKKKTHSSSTDSDSDSDSDSSAAAGQLLHNHQRICFASETRQEKAKKCAIKKKYSFKEKRAKALDKLVKFDPAEWPAEAYNEIEKRTTMSRLDSWENRPFRANEPSSSAQ
ncbi:unnamed protein product [Tilletia caries]|nr:unnamed protein product [Tilletia caries]